MELYVTYLHTTLRDEYKLSKILKFEKNNKKLFKFQIVISKRKSLQKNYKMQSRGMLTTVQSMICNHIWLDNG